MTSVYKKIIVAVALITLVFPWSTVQAYADRDSMATAYGLYKRAQTADASGNPTLGEDLYLEASCYASGTCSAANPWVTTGWDDAGATALTRRLLDINRRLSDAPSFSAAQKKRMQESVDRRLTTLKTTFPNAYTKGGTTATGDAAKDTTVENGNKSALEIACDAKYSWFNGDCLVYIIANILMWILWIFSWILRGTNQLFNLVINFSVVKFSLTAESQGLKIAWGVVRDLVNVSLLFALLYAAIGMITEIGNIDSKRIVKNIILVALLVNFSFFFTGFVIKASNTVTKFLYDRAGGASGQSTDAPDITTRIFAGRINPSFGKLPPNEPGKPTQSTFGGVIANFAGDFILIILTSIALIAAMIMFAARFIKLLFLLVLSPLAFLGFAIGGRAKARAEKWLDSLINNCIFPIVFLIFIMMTAELGASGALTQGNGFIDTLVMAIIINGMIIGGLMAASALGAMGASGAMGLLNRAKTGALGFVGQRTLGKAGYAASRALSGDTGQKFMAKNPRIGMALKNFSEKVSGGKFGGKGSFKKDVEDRAKFTEKFDTAERKAEYIANLNKPIIGRNIPIVNRALNVLPIVGGIKQAQQAAFEKLKPKDQAEIQLHLKKEREEEKKEENRTTFKTVNEAKNQAVNEQRDRGPETKEGAYTDISELNKIRQEAAANSITIPKQTIFKTINEGLTKKKKDALNKAVETQKKKNREKTLTDIAKERPLKKEEQDELDKLKTERKAEEAAERERNLTAAAEKLAESGEKGEGGGDKKPKDEPRTT
jgi:hypothetical protein